MIKECRYDSVAIWLGLFAMLMIHIGPLISGAQALAQSDAQPLQSAAVAMQSQSHAHADNHAAEPLPLLSVEASEHAEHGVDYHAMMGHHSAPAGAPQWLVNLAMCGYCDLLTVSPPLILALLVYLSIVPPVLRFAVLPALPKPLAAAYQLSHPRAPPHPFFA